LPESIFADWVPHASLPERLAQADVLAFPSLREFGGGVVLEAMAMGLVPVVVRYGGPVELVTPECGFGLPMGSRSEIVASLRAVLEKLVLDPSGIRAMGERARERVFRSFTWDAKASQMIEVYGWVLGQRDRPDFSMPLTG
jgi:starch synthase